MYKFTTFNYPKLKRIKHILLFVLPNEAEKRKGTFLQAQGKLQRCLIAAPNSYSRKYFISFCLAMLFVIVTYSQTYPVFTITKNQPSQLINPKKVPWYIDKNSELNYDSIVQKEFYPYPEKEFLIKEANWRFFTKFSLLNNTGSDREYVLQFQKTGKIEVFIAGKDNDFVKLQTGSLLKLHERSVPANTDAIKFSFQKNINYKIVVHFQPVYSLYIPLNFTIQVQEFSAFIKSDTRRLLWQGIFIGIIMVMALYNFFIFAAVKDISYLYYVLSIISVGTYFAFYYGIGIEYLWPNNPLWDIFCYTLIVPFTAIARLLFTRTYLHTPHQLPALNRLMNILLVACSLTFLVGLISFIFRIDVLKPFVEIIGVLNILVLMLMPALLKYLKQKKLAGNLHTKIKNLF